MIGVLTAKEMKAVENRDLALRRIKPDSIVMAAAARLEEHILLKKPQSVLILAGNGRTGEVGIMTAHLLKSDTGIDVTVAMERADDSIYYQLLYLDEVRMADNQRTLRSFIEGAGLIIDCIYGMEKPAAIGFPFGQWIEWTNAAGAEVISVEMPSGIDPDNGRLIGSAIRAAETVCLQYPKRGVYLYPGSVHAGKVTVLDVGYTEEAGEAVRPDTLVYEYEDIKKMLPERHFHSHKGTYGKTLLIAGSAGKTGAAILCGKALLKSGGGLLTVMSYEEVIQPVCTTLYEAMTISFNKENYREVIRRTDLKDYTNIVIGPGLGRNEITEDLMRWALESSLPCVIDADGLFYLGRHLDLLKRKPLTVITPHAMEYSRIFAYCQETIIEDLLRISEEYPSLIIVLKGERTLTAAEAKIAINTTGNNSLAKGGSGDVLCGIVGGFVSQACCRDSVIAAVYVHSLAADYWIRQHSQYSLLASQLIEEIDKVLFTMKGNSPNE